MIRPLDQLPYIEWTDDSGATQRLYADVEESETLGLPAEVTDFAVETGAKPSDHYVPGAVTGRVALVFSGTPIRPDLDDTNVGTRRTVDLDIRPQPGPGGARALTSAVKGFIGLGPPPVPDQAVALQFDRDPNRAPDVYDLILDWRSRGTLLTYGSTIGRRVEDLALVNADISRDAAIGGGSRVTLDFKQLSFVSSDVALAVPLPVEKRALPKKSAPATAGVETPAPPSATFFGNILNSVGASPGGGL